MLEPLITMGDTIGYLDKDMQVKTIDFTIEQIEERMYQIKDQVIKNQRPGPLIKNLMSVNIIFRIWSRLSLTCGAPCDYFIVRRIL